ncbi:exosortase F system-associated membrane protein [Riemerella columbipharyngis]|uniref:Exosortase F-associated protein n=1 Tax=Riemerella columbipharyngis TaxID=1071918 RepID=A0A1G7F3X7_9FLAO|nr:exosortase F system-associated protein [Riemerella columbipharyngis]SDE70663.1 exosortase F-associated protein [Riemerella columbipharyngis]
MRRKIISWILVLLGILGLISVKFLEGKIFYDPMIKYFSADGFSHPDFPHLHWGKLIVGHLFRFFLNAFFSTVIIQFMFRNKLWTLQAVVLISVVFAITFPMYLYCLYTEFQWGVLISFYIRRFVIQPLLLLMIIPIFYYKKEMGK